MEFAAKRAMKIAIVGTRGIPANYGGFETFAEELSTRLVERGHEVFVYCRKGNINWPQPYYKGVRLVLLPTLKHKYLDTVAHTFLSVFHVIFTRMDIVFFCNAINSSFMILPRLCGKKTVINVDGLEWKRQKWGRLGKFAYRTSEKIATLFANEIVSDSRGIQRYYKEKFSKNTIFIPYGADIEKHAEPGEIMKKYGLEKRGYILHVSRLEPDNNAHILIKAYENVRGDMPLVIVGDAPYGKPYIRKLRSTKDKRIKFLGGIYGSGYHELQNNAFIYIHGNEVGGTNPALLEAMAHGNCVIANGVSFNKEVVGDAGVWFRHNDVTDLKNKIQHFIDNPEETNKYRVLAVERIRKYYNWNDVVGDYENLFTNMLKK